MTTVAPMKFIFMSGDDAVSATTLENCKASLTSLSCDFLPSNIDLRQMSKLKQIELTAIDSFESVAEKLPRNQLEHLYLSGFSTDLSLFYNNSIASFDCLTHLQLVIADNINNTDFLFNSWNCPMLKYLCVNWYPNARNNLNPSNRPITMLSNTRGLKFVNLDTDSIELLLHVTEILGRNNGNLSLRNSNILILTEELKPNLQKLKKLYLSYYVPVEVFRICRKFEIETYVNSGFMSDESKEEFDKIMKKLDEKEEVKSNNIKVAGVENGKRWEMTEHEISGCYVNVFTDENVHLWHDKQTHIRIFK